MRNPSIYTAREIYNSDDCVQTHYNGEWIPARPMGWQGFRWFKNLKLALLVYVGKYDVLNWEDN